MLLELAIGGMLLGTGLQAYGQYQEGQLASQVYKYNRALSLQYARAIREIRAWEASMYYREVAKVLPKQQVITAAAGLEVSGTPLKVMKETRQKLYEQGEIMRKETEMEIAQIEGGAKIAGFRGQLAERGGRFGAFSTLLTGLGNVGLTAYQYYG